MTVMTPTFLDMPLPLSKALAFVKSSTVLVPAFLVFLIIYHVLAPLYTTSKQLSWILTTVASAAMVIASIPFVWEYAITGMSVKTIQMYPIWGYTACRIFQAYLLSDLVMGATYYRDQVGVLTGWFHHSLYILIVELAIKRAWTHIFCLCLLMELPTFILAIASLYPHLRSNTLFAASFFATRIALHISLCLSFFRSENRALVSSGSVLPAVLLACVFPMHAVWFHGCIKGFAKRRASSSAIIRVANLDLKSTPHGVVLSMDMPGTLYPLL